MKFFFYSLIFKKSSKDLKFNLRKRTSSFNEDISERNSPIDTVLQEAKRLKIDRNASAVTCLRLLNHFGLSHKLEEIAVKAPSPSRVSNLSNLISVKTEQVMKKLSHLILLLMHSSLTRTLHVLDSVQTSQ